MLTRYISYLTQGYGVDPDVTWLLDNREIYILPIANPDGYFQVYSNGYQWYKNTDNDDGCATPQWWGTDLNSNYPFHWNEVGVSSDPCDLSYRGPFALSEPESQHVLSTFEASNPDLVLSLQAPGPAVLYPWGWSSQPAPDVAGLDALGWNLGRLNGTPRQSVRSHNANTPVSGILDDTVYGVYGVPAYTFNIGASLSPICADLGPMWEAQRPAFLYATKAVGSNMSMTLSHAFGPTPRDLSISPAISPESIQVTGVLSANYGVVMGAVYSIDEPQGDGAGTAMSGNFGGGIANVSATVDTSDLTNGRHLLFVQGKNGANQWGVLSSAFFTITASAYWFVTYEDAGAVMLAASVGAFAFVGAWLWFQHRNLSPRPEDRGDASPADADADGDMGYFPSSSAWPFVLALGVVIVANGMVFGPPIAVVGAILMLGGIIGYAREADSKA